MINLNNNEIRRYIEEYLRDYQAEGVENIIKIFNSEVYNRFASVVSPTGSGKSFIAMALMQMFNVLEFKADGFDVNNPRNISKILYIAPTKDILLQIKNHIVKNIYLPNLKNKNGIIFENLSVEQKDDIVTTLFPKLLLKCYAGIKGLVDPRDKDVLREKDAKDADLIIMDEAHRSGAKDWFKRIKKIIGKNDAKILAISATPERNDEEGKEMMAEIAKMVYKDEVVTPDKYMAQEIYVLDAMRDGIINNPKVLFDNFYLYYSSEYQDVLKRWKNEENALIKRQLGDILDEMETIIGISSKEYDNREIPEEIERRARISATNKLIKEELNSEEPFGKMKPNDKAIVFIPNRENSSDDLQDYFERYIEEIQQYYEGIIDPKTGRQIKVIPHIISSDYSAKENEIILSEFENISENVSGIHILITQNKGAEGLHIDGGKIVYDLRGGEKTNATLQRAGRIINSLDKNKPLCEQSKTRFFDIKGSLYRQAVKGVGRKNSIQYDIYRLNQILEWINNNGRYPDINAGAEILDENLDSEKQAFAEEEARIAYSIKRYQTLVKQYKLGYGFEPGEESKVNDFIELIEKMPQYDGIGFMGVKIGERTKLPLESDLFGIDFLSTNSEQDRFLNLYSEAVKLGKKRSLPAKSRVDKVMYILNIISTFKPDLKLPRGIITKEQVQEFGVSRTREIESKKDELSLDLRDFLKANFNENEIRDIMVLLKSVSSRKLAYHGENYDFGKELAFARGIFFTAKQSQTDTKHNPFDEYDIKSIINSGLVDFSRCPELYEDIYKMFYLEKNEFLNVDDNGDMTLKKEEDIPWYKVEKHRINPPYSAMQFGVLDQFDSRSLITGEKIEIDNSELNMENEKNIFEEEISQREQSILEKTRINHQMKIAENPDRYFLKNERGVYEYRHELKYGPYNRSRYVYLKMSQCDEHGYVLEDNPDTGLHEYHLLKDIEVTRFVMTQMIDFGKSFMQVCEEFMEYEGISIDRAEKLLGHYISNTFSIYKDVPSILEPQFNKNGGLIYSGIDELLKSNNNRLKADRIKRFLHFAKEIAYTDVFKVRKEVFENDERLIDFLEEESIRQNSKNRSLNGKQKFELHVARKRVEDAKYLDKEK